MQTKIITTLILLGLHAAAAAQGVPLRVVAREGESPLPGVRVAAGAVAASTDSLGRAVLRLPIGEVRLRLQKPGYAEHELTVRLSGDTTITVQLEPVAFEEEAIVVLSTRADRRIEDEPVRVEVIGREEIEEKLLMTPGDIAMLLNETAGLRVQPTSPSLGGANVRIQGLRGRYTQLLSDGLPLFGGQTGALGPLQIPPMDLGQVEVIKGVASALYGASALGGVVNLISRRPSEEPDHELLLNQTTLGGTDVVSWNARQLNERWGGTLLLGAHRQSSADVDDDFWMDLPEYARLVVRPRLFYTGERGQSVLLTLGGMLEQRQGGTEGGEPAPDDRPFRDAVYTRRIDGGMVGRWPLGSRILSVRGSAALQDHDHRFGGVPEHDLHTTAFLESSLAGTAGRHTWVLGAALQRESFGSEEYPAFDFVHTVPGVFVQDELNAADGLTLSLSTRLDHHSEYGTFVNPRLSALFRPSDDWTVRASAGTGTYAPTPWIEETEAVGLSHVWTELDLDAERARSASLDVSRTLGPFELNATLFGSILDNAVQTRQAPTGVPRIELFNSRSETRTHGTELLARYHVEGVHVTSTYVYTRSTEPDPDGNGSRAVPLTPRHTASLVAALESEDRGRAGFELYYVGEQPLDDNPYRTASRPYVIAGFLVEWRMDPLRLFLNAENVLDTRQSRYDPLLLPSRSYDGRWTTDVWAPLEGRVFNAGLRYRF